MQVTGGSGNYTWHSSETLTANVNSGVLITTGRIGSTLITAADVRHSGHFDTSQVRLATYLNFVCITTCGFSQQLGASVKECFFTIAYCIL
jgi:hypothetical protein